MTQSLNETEFLRKIKNEEEIMWINPAKQTFDVAKRKGRFSLEDIEDVENRYHRFASYFEVAFPETKQYKGLLESEMTKLNNMHEWLENQYNMTLPGDFYIKRDDLLPISGTIKSRGAIYEVLKYAETLALEHGMLNNIYDNYEVFASEEFRIFFSEYNLTVGTTGNLGISVGAMGRALGFEVTVHVSADAKHGRKITYVLVGLKSLNMRLTSRKPLNSDELLQKLIQRVILSMMSIRKNCF